MAIRILESKTGFASLRAFLERNGCLLLLQDCCDAWHTHDSDSRGDSEITSHIITHLPAKSAVSSSPVWFIFSARRTSYLSILHRETTERVVKFYCLYGRCAIFVLKKKLEHKSAPFLTRFCNGVVNRAGRRKGLGNKKALANIAS